MRAGRIPGGMPVGLEDLLEDLLCRCTFPAPGERICCAVSGGPDSMALLALAVAAGCRVTAVHVDHGLRAGSDLEADVVAEAAARLGARFLAETVALEAGPNLEERAREARRAVLPTGAATGHTADDQAETVLINLLRGAGLPGLAGMRPGRRHPILALRRRETFELCSVAGLEVVHDPTNRDAAHLRNRVRHELLPQLCELAGRDVVPVLARQAGLVRDDSDLLDMLAAEIDPESAADVGEAALPLARRALRSWLRDGLGHPPPSSAVERVLAVARGEARACELPGSARVRRSAGRLIVEARTGTIPRTETPPPGAVAPVREPLGSNGVASQRSARTTAGAGVSAGAGAEDANLGDVVVSEEALGDRVRELGHQITSDYQGRPPLLVGVLKGAFVFMSDLARAIRLPVEFDFMAVASYGSATRMSGVVRILKDLDLDLSGRHVLVVEDIVDSGLTLSYLRRNLLSRHPASLEVCALLLKEGLQRTELDLKYIGFRIPPDFVVGYGLDVGQRYRNLGYVCRYVGPDLPRGT